eukprot:SM000005S17217  [mRNA]  locus=s5:840371:844061:- [translate_table: standard]
MGSQRLRLARLRNACIVSPPNCRQPHESTHDTGCNATARLAAPTAHIAPTLRTATPALPAPELCIRSVCCWRAAHEWAAASSHERAGWQERYDRLNHTASFLPLSDEWDPDWHNGTEDVHVDRRSLRFAPGGLNAIAFCQSNPDPPVYQGNVIQNPDAQAGTSGWSCFNQCKLRVGSESGNKFLVASRGQTSGGPAQNINGVVSGQPYEVVAWVRLGGGPNAYLKATLATGNGGYLCLGTAIAKAGCWTKLLGGFTLPFSGSGTIYFEGPPAGTDIWVDSFTLHALDPYSRRIQQRQNIAAYRQRPIAVTVRNKMGRPVRATVIIDQIKSLFPFGAAMPAAILHSHQFQKWYEARFNWAVFENEAKWYYTEQVQGQVSYADADAMTAYCDSQSIKIRGHNIFWQVQQYVQNWVQNLGTSQLMEAVQRRLTSVVSHYKGRFQHWDVNNEMLHGNFYSQRLGNGIASWMFRTTRQLDSSVQLFVNDYNVVEQCGDPGAMPELYIDEIRSLQAQGAQVNGIGVEAHFKQPQEVRIKHDLDALATLNLPIWFTEVDVDEEDPQTQAAYFETVMREAFSHPSVAGIVLWEVARVPCSVYSYFDQSKCTTACYKCLTDLNFNDRPVGQKYVRLRKEWSSHVWTTTDSAGTVKFRGFFGDYRANIQVKGKIVQRFFSVPQGGSEQAITLTI